ncbi:hypothetical protein HKCCSP123_12815 [Rhodobacterales bacterium HKCCSP123]|nr:hypothetical protein [Rhodobacterales bacterium HKCCSP123]
MNSRLSLPILASRLALACFIVVFGLIASGQSRAQTVQVVVNSVTYNIGFVQDTGANLSAQLVAQPWWINGTTVTDNTVARDFALGYRDALNAACSDTNVAATCGPLTGGLWPTAGNSALHFAYSLGSNTNFINVWQINQNTGVISTLNDNRNASRYYAIISAAVIPEINASSLALAAFVLLALWASITARRSRTA